MRRKIYLAAILAAVMALQAPAVAFAEEEPVPTETSGDEQDGDENGEWIIDGDVTITDDSWSSTDPESETLKDDDGNPLKSVSAYESEVVTVNGDVSSTVSQKITGTDENGEYSYIPQSVDAGAGGTVNVNGDVTSQSGGAISADNGTVKVTGNVSSGGEEDSAVVAANGSTVEIGGDVTNTGTGRGTDEESGSTYGTSNGIDVTQQSTVKVGGDVTVSSGTGMNVNGENDSTDKGQVVVDGSVSSAQDAAIITNAASKITVGEDVTGNTGITIRLNGTGGNVEVLGTVKSTKDNASVIVIETEEQDKDAIAAALPEIIVGSLEGAAGTPEDYLWISSVDGDEEDMTEEQQKQRDEVYEAVYQQILYYISKDKFDNATLSVTGANTHNNGYTSNEGNSLKVTIATADGYEIRSVSGTSVVENADGTYTVVVQRGKGIDINAVISAIVRAQQESSGSDDTPVIVVPAYAAAQEQFQAAIAAQLKTLPAGSTLTLDMKEFISFNRKTFEKLSQRKDVDIQIIYTWNGKRYLVVIPAGYDILSLLDANGYCGCLYLNSIFGATELTK